MMTQNTYSPRRLPPDNFYRQHQHQHQHQQTQQQQLPLPLNHQHFQQLQPQQQQPQQHQHHTEQYSIFNQPFNYSYDHHNHHNHNQPQPPQQQQQQQHYQNLQGLLAAAESTAIPTTLDNTNNSISAAQAAALGNIQRKIAFLNIPSPMSTEPLLFHDQATQRQGHAQRFRHQRDASSSSVGSNTPASPYSANTENPRIAVSEASTASLHDLAGAADGSYPYGLANEQSQLGQLGAVKGRGGGMSAVNVMGDANFVHGLPGLMGAQQQRQGGLAQASGRSAPPLSTRSRPMSVASSICGDSPATPPYRENEDEHRRIKNGEEPDSPILLSLGLDPESDAAKYFDDCLHFRFDDLAFDSGASIPRLDRTATDAYCDELLPQELTMTSSPPPPQTTIMRSPTSDIFAQRVQAANRQHLRATQSPASSRAHSPFVQGSPYALAMNDFPRAGTNQARLESAQQMRERRKAEEDAMQLQQHVGHNAQVGGPQDTPATISPKDAVLDYNEADVASDFPLFPAPDNNTDGLAQSNGNGNLMDRAVSQHSASPFQSMTGTPVPANFKFEMPANVPVMPQYPFVPRQQPQPQLQQFSQVAPTFSRVSSTGASNTDVSSHDGSLERRERVSADGGTYTCTYHGCTLRFDTQAQLQKHKREGHRQANVFNHLRSPSGVSNAALSSQAGPHRCDRINPSTGKPCNTVFSRPYDLTRHEDTIHNGSKKKVRCDICTEEKTFSRADALTRHYRVCHPDVPSPTKRRRAVA